MRTCTKPSNTRTTMKQDKCNRAARGVNRVKMEVRRTPKPNTLFPPY